MTASLTSAAMVLPGTAEAAAPPVCNLDQIAVTAEGGLAAGGHVGFRIHLVNAAGRTCVVAGYPRTALFDAAGDRVQTATPTTRGYLGGLETGTTPPTVTLQPGGEATSLVEGNDVVDPATCTTSTGVGVGLPHASGRTAAAIEKQTFYTCPGVEVHPFLAGTTGTA